MIYYNICGKEAILSGTVREEISDTVDFSIRGVPDGKVIRIVDQNGMSFEKVIHDGKAAFNLLGIVGDSIRVEVAGADGGSLTVTELPNKKRVLTEEKVGRDRLARQIKGIADFLMDEMERADKRSAATEALVPIVEDLRKKAESGEIIDF